MLTTTQHVIMSYDSHGAITVYNTCFDWSKPVFVSEHPQKFEVFSQVVVMLCSNYFMLSNNLDGLIQTLGNVARVKKSSQNHSPSALFS